jgi:hypothetical protein
MDNQDRGPRRVTTHSAVEDLDDAVLDHDLDGLADIGGADARALRSEGDHAAPVDPARDVPWTRHDSRNGLSPRLVGWVFGIATNAGQGDVFD